MNKSIKNILISQNAPSDLEQSQYKLLVDKYKLNLTFNKFFEVVKISNKEYRAQRINLLDYSAVIMTSKLAVDHYFSFAKQMRIVIPDDMKFFCITDSIANYLQTYIQYRKRKIFYGKLSFDELVEVIAKHSDEKYLFPCAEDASQASFKKLSAAGIDFTKIIMYRSQPKVLSNIDIKKFDMVVIFSPIGVKSFVENFPSVGSDDIIFAAFGQAAHAALKKAGIDVKIKAPTVKSPSMIMALDNFFESLAQTKTESKTTKKPKKTAKQA
ncbi:MAG: uroporphyrinogen-III synthase [Bacteroidales bacterium]|nr:uroporphyrinogen-III synthase [Bacteroidales bacterium]MBQ7984874.1 uroporphyrinogen-III synthase [Bacteroidales bacterium]